MTFLSQLNRGIGVEAESLRDERLRLSDAYDAIRSTSTRNVAVARLHLFGASETFIRAQVGAYSSYQPFYIGQRCVGPAPLEAEWLVPQSDIYTKMRLLAFRDVRPWQSVMAARSCQILHAHFAVDAAIFLKLSRRLRVPLVTTLHGFDVTTDDRRFALSRNPTLWNAVLHRRELQREGALFICVSEHIRNIALAKGFPSDRTIVHYIGVDTQRLKPTHFRSQNTIVHVGRLVEKKGTAVLIDAMPRILAQRPDAKLRIVGDGPLRQTLEDQVRCLGLQETVSFLGGLKHEQTINEISKAALVAVPSVVANNGDSEGLPTVIFEAAALGTPVVATRHSGIPEAVIHGETGLLVPERDTSRLSDQILRVLKSGETAKQLSHMARSRAERLFDLQKQTSALESYYDSILERTPRSGEYPPWASTCH